MKTKKTLARREFLKNATQVVATVAARGTQTVVRLPAGFVMNAGDVLELVLA